MARPTLRDVAARAGVDTSTVSRALNERTRGLLSPDTVARVLEVAREVGYRPNMLAQGLRTRRSQTVGMLVPDIGNPFFPPVVRGIEDELGRCNYTLIVANTDNDAERERAAVSNLLERRVDGLVLATSSIDRDTPLPTDLARSPTVLVNRRGPDPGVPFVVPDERSGTRQVVEHLHALGHRRVGHVAGPQSLSTGRTRLEEFRTACREFGMEEVGVELADRFTADAGERACAALLRRRDLTAVFAANDLLAIGALRALRRAERSVPHDVSLVGYNDMPMVDLIDPPLTTVRVPQYEMGTTAARLLLGRLLATDDGADEVVLPPTLVVRRSTCAAR